MHVLVLPSWYFPRGSSAISGRMFHHLASGLREKGVDARILFSDYSVTGPLIKRKSFEIEDQVPVQRYNRWYWPKANKSLLLRWRRKYAQDIMKYIQAEGKPDILHAHSYMAAAVCSPVARELNIPLVYTERLSSVIKDTLPDHHRFLFNEIFETASLITGVSPGMKLCLEKFTQKEVRVIPNFVDPAIFYPNPNLKKYDVFTWISIGEPLHIKGLDVLFYAFAELKKRMHDIPMQLILVDDIPQKKTLMRLAKALRIESDLVWTGLLTAAALADVINQSHVLVSASRVETFGKAIAEAQACGLPVVATETDGAKFILQDVSQGVFAEVGHAESLVKAMQKAMLRYSDFDAQQISAATMERFSKEVVIQEWINTYNALLT